MKVSARLRIVWKGHRCARRYSYATTVGTPPLRPPASLLHNAAFPKVRGSRYAKAPLDAPHRCAPFGHRKLALCKVACAGQRAGQPSSLPGRGYTSYAPSPGRPCVVLCPGFQSGASRIVLVSGLRPVTWCVPPPTLGPRRCAAWLRAELPVRPPRGLPQSARGWCCFGYCVKLLSQT